MSIGDTIQARLTRKRKADTPRKGQPPLAVVAWDVQVTNQLGHPDVGVEAAAVAAGGW